ncbi:MAG TPA: aldo/keto reductase [Flavisolibacter sp.]|jgi:aryl-alcohol dehydrogenase-like predicted oxidoreductase|nr:aldo/keto reductase [Flavisolibacter sp.]
MKYRQFGTTDLMVSEVGFGAWAIGGDARVGSTAIGWGPADDTTSKKAIHTALDAGINFFDTADIYGLGHSEKLLGNSLAGQNVILATKVGNVAREGQFTFDYSAAHIKSACEASLKRLNRQVIDYYQLHTARLSHLQEGDCIRAMEELKKQGKIRYWGLSLNTFDPSPEADFLMDSQVGQGFQLVLNILNQRALPVMKRASREGYGIIARMPLQFGLLTGKFSEHSKFTDTDHRKNRLTPEIILRTNKALQPLDDLCTKYGFSKTQLALSYILSYAEVSTIIPGIRTSEQVQWNTAGLKQLDPADVRQIEAMGTAELADLLELIQKQG